MTCYSKTIFFILVLLISVACSDQGTDKKIGKQKQLIIADTTGNRSAQVDHDIYLLKRRIAQQLSLNDMENIIDSTEIRFWVEPALYGVMQLYIVKCVDSNWSVMHYLIYEKPFNPDKDDYRTWTGFKNPKIDSFHATALEPTVTSWKNYIIQLAIDSLWSLPSQSEIKGDFGAIDGVSYSLEIADRKRYKFIHYNNPISDEDNETSHKTFIDFQTRLLAPLYFREDNIPNK